MEAGPDFPIRTDQKNAVSSPHVIAEVSIDVRTMKSIEKDGKPFSNKMDEIMYDALRATAHPKIHYWLSHLALRHRATHPDSPSEFDARGKLAVAGVTNEVSMPVNVLPLGGNQLKVWGTVSLKMTDFHIDPPSPKITLGLIKTGDEVRVSFEWVLARQN